MGRRGGGRVPHTTDVPLTVSCRRPINQPAVPIPPALHDWAMMPKLSCAWLLSGSQQVGSVARGEQEPRREARLARHSSPGSLLGPSLWGM